MNSTGNRASDYLDVPHGRLYYEVEGEGHPLLLIHAGIADSTMWDYQMPEFTKRYKVIRYDARGFGKSKLDNDEPFSNRQDIQDLLAHLGVAKTYVMGVSRGGQIATDYTLEHPEMVDALVLVGSGLGGFDGKPTDEEMALFNQGEEAWQAKDMARAADIDVRIWADGPGRPEGSAPQHVREHVRSMCMTANENFVTEGKPIVMDPPAIGRLGEIKVPTLIIVGDKDVSGIFQIADALEKGITGAKKVVMNDTAHVPNMEKPQEFNRIVLDFFDSVESARPS